MNRKNPIRKLYITLYCLFATTVVGIIGYMLIEGYSFLNAVYMTVITIATVGFSEVEPLSAAGKVFTIFIIFSGLGIFTFFLTQLSKYFLDGDFQRYLRYYKMIKEINKLDRHIIICGYGRNGREAARILTRGKMNIVVIEADAAKVEEAAQEIKFVLHADATRDDALTDAGIMRAHTIITTLPDDAQNVFVVVSAKALNPKIKIISRANINSSIKKLKSAGADNVIMPDKIGGAHMAMLVTNPDIEELIDIMSTHSGEDFLIQEIRSGKEILLGDADIWKKTGATIIGVKLNTEEYILNPAPGVKVSKGDAIIAMGSKAQISQVLEIFS